MHASSHVSFVLVILFRSAVAASGWEARGVCMAQLAPAQTPTGAAILLTKPRRGLQRLQRAITTDRLLYPADNKTKRKHHRYGRDLSHESNMARAADKQSRRWRIGGMRGITMPDSSRTVHDLEECMFDTDFLQIEDSNISRFRNRL